MIEGAKKIEPGIDYRVMDYESMDFPEGSFEGIWANASLYHVAKQNLPKTLAAILKIFAPGGLLFVKVKYGKFDGLREDEKFGKKISRYFSYYGPDELNGVAHSAGLKVLNVGLSKHQEWVDLLARRKI